MDLGGSHGVADRVAFLGHVIHDDLAALLRSCDVAVSIPWYEPFGTAPLEAMACGLPVIVSAVGGHLDTVLDGVTGLQVPARNPEALAGLLRRLIANPDPRSSLGGGAAVRVKSLYAWTRIAAETAAVYEKLLVEESGPAAVADTR
jgi:glycosyltransferase involved in cell wall biosynthesis